MVEEQSKTNWFIYYAAFSVNLLTLSTGVSFSWTSPILPTLNSTDPNVNPLGKPITLSESAWIVSLMSFGLICASPLSIILSKFFCKKTILLLASIPLIVCHIILIFANQAYQLMLARLLMGISTGTGWIVLPTYVAEIAEDKNRGALGSIAGIMTTTGTLLPYLLGPYMSMRLFSTLNLIPLSAYYIFFGYFIPNSPYDLIIQNKQDEAKQNLIKLRRSSKVEKELAYIDSFVKTNSNGKGFLDLFRDKVLWKVLKLCSILMIFQQLSGIIAVVSYTQTIFDLSGSSLSSEISSIITGCVAVIAVSIVGKLIDTKGRKVLLTISCILTFTSVFSLAIYFLLHRYKYNLSSVFWLPICSLILYLFAFNFGLGILPWVVLGEIFPSDVKATASTIIALVNYSMSFLVNISFPYLIEIIGISGAFFVFSTFMAMATIYSIVILPETKGKSFQEIQIMIGMKSDHS